MALTIFRAGPHWVHFSTTSTQPVQHHSVIVRRNELEAAQRRIYRSRNGRTKIQGQPVDESTVEALLQSLDANSQASLF